MPKTAKYIKNGLLMSVLQNSEKQILFIIQEH